MIIDLTLPVFPDMAVFPNDPPVVFHSVFDHTRSGFSVHELRFGTHTGTHIDAPHHYLPNGESVDANTVLTASVGFASVFDVAAQLENGEITPASLGDSLNTIEAGDRILFATGWSDRFGASDYYTAFPSISEELAQILVDKNIALLGIDTPSLNRYKDEAVHMTLLSAGVIIVENLAHLNLLTAKRVFFSAAPLRLRGIDGSPVRAYALIGDSDILP